MPFDYLKKMFDISVNEDEVEKLGKYLLDRDQNDGIDADTIVIDHQKESELVLVEGRIPSVNYHPGDEEFIVIMNSYAGEDRNKLIFAYEWLSAFDLISSENEIVTGQDLHKIMSESKLVNDIKDFVSTIDYERTYDLIDFYDIVNSRSREENKTETSDHEFTRFEKARIIGARALQISYGAPVLVDYPEDMLDPIDIAMLEYDEGLIPITVVKN